MALILHLDTSASSGIAMLSQDGSVISIKISNGEREHAGNINRLVQEALKEAGKIMTELNAISVCNGPGSYTGLRIGLATAKGFCYALDKPLMLHSRLQLMLEEAAAKSPDASNLLAILPARVGEIYAAGRGTGELDFPPGHFMVDEIVSLIEGKMDELIMISSSQDEMNNLTSNKTCKQILHTVLDLDQWASRAMQDFEFGRFANLAYSEPEYLKAVYFNPKR